MDLEFSKFNDKLIQEKLKVPNNIFIDLSIMKDFYLGVVLSCIEDNKQYQYLLQNITTYENRYIDNIEYVLPKLNITQQQCLNKQQAMSGLQIFQAAPSTIFNSVLRNIIVSINNKTAAAQNSAVPTLYFSTYPLVLPKPICNAICNSFQHEFAVNVNVTQKAIYQCEVDFVKTLDMIFTNDIKSFIEHPNFTDIFSKLIFVDTSISATKRIASLDVFNVHKDEEALNKDFIVTEIYIQFMSRFNYMPSLKIAK